MSTAVERLRASRAEFERTCASEGEAWVKSIAGYRELHALLDYANEHDNGSLADWARVRLDELGLVDHFGGYDCTEEPSVLELIHWRCFVDGAMSAWGEIRDQVDVDE